MTGSHRASLGALVDRACDVASVDVTVWKHTLLERPEAVSELRVIDRTADWPAPPFSLSTRLETGTHNRLREALHSLGPADIASLDGVVPAGLDSYQDEMRVRPACLQIDVDCVIMQAMPVQITIRGVPDVVRDELAAKAALNRQSMQEYLRCELERIASRPSLATLLSEVRRRKAAAGTSIPSSLIVEARDADRT